MEDVVDWLRDRPYHEGQVTHHRTVPASEASFADLDVDDRLAAALADRGIERPYAHQAEAVRAVRAGRDVVLATPTASGKSLAYTVPAFERAMDDRATALYVAPQVALITDQADTLSSLAGDLGFASGVRVDRYTGRLSRSEKEAVRERQPTVLLTTPDMLHYGILPHGRRLWDWFLERLETVVVDEVHEYRGVFGSHVSLVLRRLSRLAAEFGADPEWLCCSATVGNPVEHAATVTGRPAEGFACVTEDASATGPRHWLFWNPPTYDDEEAGFGDGGRRRSNHVATKRLFVDLVARGHQTVAFTGARQTAERYASESADALGERGDHDAAGGVTAYQAALPDDRRRTVEDGLHDGSIRGVWSTSALELGVDVGGLDAVLLDGYPGTRMAAFQRAGRAGRGEDPALVVLVADEDQLDQYVVANPASFFGGDPERAVANPANPEVLPDHVAAAAHERWLRPGDDRQFGERFPDVVAALEADGTLDRRDTAGGVRWTTAGSPAHDVNLRRVDDREVRLRDRRDGSVLATLPFADALRDAHRGAIYHQQGQSYEVVELDLDAGVADCEPTWADYYTRVRHDKAMTVEADVDEKRLPAREDCVVRFAEVTRRKQITGFERRDAGSGELLGEEPLDLPETSLTTRALYLTVPDDVVDAMAAVGDVPGGLHAAEHGTIAMFPAEVLCDRRDVGGLSTPLHPHTGEPTVFVYDGHPGGVGLARTGYDDVADLLATTLAMLRACDCDDGCPACVQSPHCGNANDPLSRAAATVMLDELTAGDRGS